MVPALSHKVPRASWYSGYCCAVSPFMYGAFTLFGRPSQGRSIWLNSHVCSPNPAVLRTTVWALPGSLAATSGITFCFLFLRLLRCFSSPGSPHTAIWSLRPPLLYGGRVFPGRVSPFRHPRIYAYLQLPAAFRSLSRLSSALSAKASALRSFLLNLYNSNRSVTNETGGRCRLACIRALGSFV